MEQKENFSYSSIYSENTRLKNSNSLKKFEYKLFQNVIIKNSFIIFLSILFLTLIIIFILLKLNHESSFSHNNNFKRIIPKLSKENITNNTVKKEIKEIMQNISNLPSYKRKDIYEEIKDSQKYVNIAINGTLINPNKTFYKSDNPKISVIIAMFNAEGYIRNALLSIQNQDFNDIEIIIIDDFSKDNCTNIVKDMMGKDPRIVLYKNEENKGTLYSKTKGVLSSKGKYVIILDQDDMFVQTEAFSTMYDVLETYNLDILGFGSLFARTSDFSKDTGIFLYYGSSIIYQPELTRQMYKGMESDKIIRVGDVIWSYIFKTEVFIKSIKQIDNKIMDTKMTCHEDFLLFFLLTRNANSLKHMKRLFYAHIKWFGVNNTKILFTNQEKSINKKDLKCMSVLNYIEFLLMKTNDNVIDKRIASFELKNWFDYENCDNNTFIQKRKNNVYQQFLNNIYIEDHVKKIIIKHLNESNRKYY